MPPATSSRWCPAQEQRMILEGIYKGGIKTPNTAQIHEITEKLSSYGKIEGKNVFYWFQNHKARDKSKLRRKLAQQHKQKFTYNMDTKVKNETWKMERVENKQKPMLMRMNGNDWMMMVVDVKPYLTPCCSEPKLKTLELFPIKATNLKEEFKNPSKNPNFSDLPSLTFSLGF